MQLRTNIVGLIIITVFIGCGLFETNDNDGFSDKVYVALQGLDQVAIIELNTGGKETIDISYEFSNCSGLDFEECIEKSGCMWMASHSHCMAGNSHEPHFIAIDEINRYWFVTTIMTGWVGRYSLDTNELIDKIMVGDFPALMSLDKDSQKLYVSRMMTMEMSGGSMGATTTSIQVINYADSETMNFDESHPIGSPAPHGIAINSDGTEVYTASYEADWLFKIMTQSDIIEETTLEIGYSQDKSYPLKRLKPVQCVSVQDSLLFISCEAGNWSSIGDDWESIPGQIQLWNTNTMMRIDTLQFDVDSRPWHIINSPNTNRVYVVLKGEFEYEDNPDSDGVACISYNDNSMNLKWIKHSDEFKILHGIDISVDGEKLYVSGRIDGKLHVLNAQDGDLLQSIYLGPEIATKPSGVTYYSGSH